MGRFTELDDRFDAMPPKARLAMNVAVLVPAVVLGFLLDLPKPLVLVVLLAWAVLVAAAALLASERLAHPRTPATD